MKSLTTSSLDYEVLIRYKEIYKDKILFQILVT